MNIYVETNFILEIALLQEQRADCEQILTLCNTLDAKLLVPGYCLIEPYETLIRRQRNRTKLKEQLDKELEQISRTETNRESLSEFGNVTEILLKSAQDDSIRFDAVSERMLQVAEVISLNSGVLVSSEKYRHKYRLSPQDSIVYASILSDLSKHQSSKNFFISRDRKFSDQDIVEELQSYNCIQLSNFGHAYDAIRHSLS